MNSIPSFMSALGYGGGTRPIVRPPTMIRPYPPGIMPPEDDLAQALRAEQPGYLPGGMQPPSMPVPPNVPGPRRGDIPLVPQMAPSPYENQQPIPPRGSQLPPSGIVDTNLPSKLPGGMQPPSMPSSAPDINPDNEEPGLGRRFLAALGQSMARLGRQSTGQGSFKVRRPRTE